MSSAFLVALTNQWRPMLLCENSVTLKFSRRSDGKKLRHMCCITPLVGLLVGYDNLYDSFYLTALTLNLFFPKKIFHTFCCWFL